MVQSLLTTKISDNLQLKGLCPEIMKGLFQFRNETPYSLRQRSQFHVPPVRTVFSGTESIKFLGPKIWELK